MAPESNKLDPCGKLYRFSELQKGNGNWPHTTERVHISINVHSGSQIWHSTWRFPKLHRYCTYLPCVPPSQSLLLNTAISVRRLFTYLFISLVIYYDYYIISTLGITVSLSDQELQCCLEVIGQ